MLLAVITVALALPVVVAMAFAIRRRWNWVAPTMAAAAVSLQLLGLTSTCTQGANGSFIAGAIYSAPFLAVAILLTLWTVRRRTAVWRAAIITALVPLVMLFLTQSAWINSLFYGTPCGVDYAGFYASDPAHLLIILVGYLALPLLLTGCATWAVFRGAGPPQESSALTRNR